MKNTLSFLKIFLRNKFNTKNLKRFQLKILDRGLKLNTKWRILKYGEIFPVYMPSPSPIFYWPTRITQEAKFAITQQASHILTRVEENKSVLDVGSHSGFYSFHLARQFPHSLIYSIEPEKYLIEFAQFIDKIEGIKNVSYSSNSLNPKNIFALPDFDYTINLSVFHQWARSYGFENARIMLEALWSKTKIGMFFSMADTHGSPKNLGWLPNMGGSAEECEKWIIRNLFMGPSMKITLLDRIITSYKSKHPRSLFYIYRA